MHRPSLFSQVFYTTRLRLSTAISKIFLHIFRIPGDTMLVPEVQKREVYLMDNTKNTKNTKNTNTTDNTENTNTKNAKNAKNCK